jgi:toxin ParE1/3/4
MKYGLVVAESVEEDLLGIFRHIARDNPRAALRLVRKLKAGMRALAAFPRRCPVAPEGKRAGAGEIRHAVAGNYRIIFVVDESVKTVGILEVRHAARLPKGE